MKEQKHVRSLSKVPRWVKNGEVVNYHSVLNGPVTHPGIKIISAPWLLGGHTAVVMVEGVSGAVSVGALSKVVK